MQIEDRLEHNSIKPTAMRVLLLQHLMGLDKATSLKDLEEAFCRADKSTLFRTLKTFEKYKLVHRIDDGSGLVKYALCMEGCECAPQDQHFHFHCRKCQNTYCLPDQPIPQIKLPTTFELEKVNFVIQGLCGSCKVTL